MKWTVYGGRERASFGSRILLVSCLFLLCALALANFSKHQNSNFVYAASVADTKTTKQPEPAPLIIPKTMPSIDEDATKNAELSRLITDWVQAQPSSQQWGVAVKGFVGTSINASYGADTSFQSASIYKLYVTYALSKIMPSSQWSATVPGDTRTYNECVVAMMQKSDNPCGDSIGDSLGWSRVNSLARAAGYNHTKLSEVPLMTTPNDTVQFLQDLYTGKNFSSDVRDQIITAMQHSVFRSGIVAGCPDCNVANKTGILNGYNHDVAIIQVEDKDFGLAIFSKDGSVQQIAALTKLIQQHVRNY